jgi:hypothetical protein
MTTGPISELVVPYDPEPLTEKVERRRRLLRSRLISLVITIAVLLLIYLWQRENLDAAFFMVLCAIVLAVSLVSIGITVALLVTAKREFRGLGSGTAIRIGPAGIQVAGLSAAWPEVVSINTIKGGVGRDPRLRLTTIDGRRADVPLDQVTVFPATLDSTVRAFSAGRHGVDLSAIDS